MRKVLMWVALACAGMVNAADGVPTNAGETCTFVEGVRYSQLVIDARINDFKANTKVAGFGTYDSQGNQLAAPQSSSTTLDYVPGLVAKAIIEAVDYYKDSETIDVAPWYYAVQSYANRCDITSNGKNGKSFDDLNAVKLYFVLSQLAASGRFADSSSYSNATTIQKAGQRFADALRGIAQANSNYVIKASTLQGAAGGWWHKSSYTNQMWCDGQYMGPALLAQMINEYDDYAAISDDDWALLIKQFTISWHYLWDDEAQLLYHAFTADPGGSAASKWAGVSATTGAEVYHSAEYWGRAAAWYFLALVDVLEQLELAGMKDTEHYQTLRGYLQLLAAGIAARQDDATGCWYQLLAHDGTFVADSYNQSYRYTSSPVANYLEASCSAIFIAAYLKGMRLGLYDTDYTDLATKAYRGFVEHFMVSDGNGGVHLVYSCRSAGLGGSNYRDGSAAYYLLGKDTQPTGLASSDFYTEGKVLGGFILAATEYERLFDQTATDINPDVHYYNKGENRNDKVYDLQGRPMTDSPKSKGPYLLNGKKLLNP